MYQDLKRTCRAIVLLIKKLLFADVLVAVAVVVCFLGPIRTSGQVLNVITFLTKGQFALANKFCNNW